MLFLFFYASHKCPITGFLSWQKFSLCLVYLRKWQNVSLCLVYSRTWQKFSVSSLLKKLTKVLSSLCLVYSTIWQKFFRSGLPRNLTKVLYVWLHKNLTKKENNSFRLVYSTTFPRKIGCWPPHVTDSTCMSKFWFYHHLTWECISADMGWKIINF